MINNRQTGRRSRGRTNNPRPQGGSGGRPDQGNRIDNRARGNAPQLLEKYKGLARDAQMQGDRVLTEYYHQFADHYFRVINDNRARYEEQRQGQGQGGREDYPREQQGRDFDDGFEEGYEGEPIDQNDRRPDGWQDRGQQGQPRDYNDRGSQDRGQQERGQQDRNQQGQPRDDRGEQRPPRDNYADRGQQDRGQQAQPRDGYADRGQQGRDSRQQGRGAEPRYQGSDGEQSRNGYAGERPQQDRAQPQPRAAREDGEPRERNRQPQSQRRDAQPVPPRELPAYAAQEQAPNERAAANDPAAPQGVDGGQAPVVAEPAIPPRRPRGRPPLDRSRAANGSSSDAAATVGEADTLGFDPSALPPALALSALPTTGAAADAEPKPRRRAPRKAPPVETGTPEDFAA